MRITGITKHVFPHILRDNKFFPGPAEALATSLILSEVKSDCVLGVVFPSKLIGAPKEVGLLLSMWWYSLISTESNRTLEVVLSVVGCAEDGGLSRGAILARDSHGDFTFRQPLSCRRAGQLTSMIRLAGPLAISNPGQSEWSKSAVRTLLSLNLFDVIGSRTSALPSSIFLFFQERVTSISLSGRRVVDIVTIRVSEKSVYSKNHVRVPTL